MTTIAYRDGVLAGDRRATAGTSVEHDVTKVFRRADGALVGASGQCVHMRSFCDWFLAGELPETKPKFDTAAELEALVIRPDGNVEWHSHAGWISCEGSFFAIGSGGCVALGAMEMGAGAELAVEIACRRDSHTGNGVDVVSREADAWIASRA